MYACAEAVNPDFERIRGNPVCRSVTYPAVLEKGADRLLRFIDWGLQNQYDSDGKEILPRPRDDEVDEERFEAWREGRTGFPLVAPLSD